MIIMHRKLQRSDFIIYAMLGRFGDFKDARPVVDRIKACSSPIVIPEDASTTAKDRQSKVTILNRNIVTARKSEGIRKRLLDYYRAQTNPLASSEFMTPIMEAIIDKPNARAYYIEEQSEGKTAVVDRLLAGYTDILDQVCIAIANKKIAEAAEHQAQFYFSTDELLDRKKSLIDGFVRMETELEFLFNTGFKTPIEVVAAYGALHINAFEELGQMGFNVEISLSPEAERDMCFQIGRRTQLARGKMSAADKLQLLFAQIYSRGIDEGFFQPDQREQVFERIGNEAGFERAVLETELRTGAPSDIILRRVIRQIQKQAGVI